MDGNVRTVVIGSCESQDEPLCGGKGCSLGFLKVLSEDKSTPNGFTVPPGFIVTTNAFKSHVKGNEAIGKLIHLVESVACKRTSGSLQEACDRLVQSFEQTPIDSSLTEEIENQFQAMGEEIPSLHVAVRSSAIGEDSAEASVAGQNETFLGVKSFASVMTSIQKCWASLFSYRSVSYRIQNAQPVRTAMAVVVQAMVPAEAAGVLFTWHPLDNNPNKILITANYGLGEVRILRRIF